MIADIATNGTYCIGWIPVGRAPANSGTAGGDPSTGGCAVRPPRPKLPAVDEPLAELAAYFRDKTRLPDKELIRLTLAARAAGSRWEAIAAACGIQTYQDLAGVIYRITGDTGAELLFAATQYAVGQVTGSRRLLAPLTWACPDAGARSPTVLRPVGLSTSSMAMLRAVPGWSATRPPMTSAAATSFPA